jgi:cell division septation protein DedD
LGTALLLATTLALSACGFAARNLAKQVSDLTKKAANIERQTAELQEMAGEIEEKAAALSPRNRQKYHEELVRLGFEAPDWLFGDTEALASSGSSGATGTPPQMPTPAPAPSTTAPTPAPTPTPATTPTPTPTPATAPVSGPMTWTAVRNTAFGADAIMGIVYGNNRFVAVGQGGIAYADW